MSRQNRPCKAKEEKDKPAEGLIASRLEATEKLNHDRLHVQQGRKRGGLLSCHVQASSSVFREAFYFARERVRFTALSARRSVLRHTQQSAAGSHSSSSHIGTPKYTHIHARTQRERERDWGGWEGVHTHSSTFSKILHFQLTCYVSIRAATQMHNLIMYKIQNVDSC